MTTEAHNRNPQFWDLYFAVVAGSVAVVALVADGNQLWRRLVSAAAIAAMAALYLTVARRRIRKPVDSLAPGIGFVVLFAVTVAAVPFTTWLLFAVIPLFFQLVEMRQAFVLVVLVNLVNPAVDVFEGPERLPVDLVIAVISAATGIWLGYWMTRVVHQNIERGQLIEQLEASRAEIARLSHEAGISAERARLAGEIHDTLAQGFTSIVTLLQAADPELRDERLALAVRTAKENLAEARALVAALAPAALSEGSLADSVRRQAARFSEESGVPATVRVTGTERALPTPVEVVLLRAAQESMTNVRRHAAATDVQVLLAYGDGTVRLTVRDDGCGIDPEKTAGFGLTGMRARADQVDGTLTVRGGNGTTIELEVPA